MSISITHQLFGTDLGEQENTRPLKCSCLTVYILVKGVACIRSDASMQNTLGSLFRLSFAAPLQSVSFWGLLLGSAVADTHTHTHTLTDIQSEGWGRGSNCPGICAHSITFQSHSVKVDSGQSTRSQMQHLCPWVSLLAMTLIFSWETCSQSG